MIDRIYMRRRFWLIALILIFGAIVWYVWSLGSLPGVEQGSIRLQVEKSPVEIRHAPGTAWVVATGTVMLAAGDGIRTGSEGRATLQMFEMSEHRLGASTELHIDPTTSSDLASGQTVAHLRLQAGRVWSRVVRLLDLRSSMQIETTRVVATVRGTAFDLDAASTSTWIHVAHGAVALFPQGASSSVFAAEEQRMMFDDRGIHPTLVSSTIPASPWVQENTSKDEAFLTRLQTDREHALSDLGEIHPDQLRDRLAVLSERLHLMLAGDGAPALYGRYLARRLYAIKKMTDAQMSGGAFQALSTIEEDVRAHTRGSNPAYVAAVVQGINQVAFLLEQATPDSSLYRLKQRLEDLELSILPESSPEFLYARLLTIEARLNETAMFLDQGSLQAAAQEIEAAHQGIANVGPDLKGAVLVEKLSALQAREGALRRVISLRSVMLPPVAVPVPLEAAASSSTPSLPPTSTQPTASTSSSPVLAAPSSTPSIPSRTTPSPAPRIIGLQITPVVSTLAVGSRPSFGGQARYSDGTTKDVTSLLRWSSSNLRLGFFVGSTFYPSAPGTVTMTASYAEAGMTQTTSLDILITP